jgi:hypothetical protein
VTTGGGKHAADIGFGHGTAGEIDRCNETFAAEAAARHRHHDGLELHTGSAFSMVDSLANHLLRFDQVDNRTRLHSLGRSVSECQQTNTVAATTEDILRCLRLKPRNEANDFARANVEARDDGGALERNRLHLRGNAEAQHGHASPPFPDFDFLAFSASLRACSRANDAASD